MFNQIPIHVKDLFTKKEIKELKTVTMPADFIRSSVNSDLYSIQGDPIWFDKNDGVIFNSGSKEIEIPLKLAKKKFPNENF
jgi:hypothetical protein